jgi:hypothetical protein
MIDRNEDRFSYVRIALVMVLFLLVLSAFSTRTVKQGPVPSQSDLVSIVLSGNQNALEATAVQLPSFQKSWVTCIDRMKFHLFDVSLKNIPVNRIINQRLVFLRSVELKVKPLLFKGQHYRITSVDPPELPSLR